MSDAPDPAELLPERLRRPPPDPAKVRRTYRLGLATLALAGAAAVALQLLAPVTTIAARTPSDGAALVVVERGFREEARRELPHADAKAVVTTPVLGRDARGMPANIPQLSVSRRGGGLFVVHTQAEEDSELAAALTRWIADPQAGFEATRGNRATALARRLAILLGLLAALGAYLAWMSGSLLRQMAGGGAER